MADAGAGHRRGRRAGAQEEARVAAAVSPSGARSRWIIHTHSPRLLAFAMAGQPLPDRYEALLRFGQAEDVPVVPWAPRGSERSVGGIIGALAAQPSTLAVLLANHGDLVLGGTPAEAAALLTVLEEAAEAELAAAPLGGAAPFPAGALEQVRASMSPARA